MSNTTSDTSSQNNNNSAAAIGEKQTAALSNSQNNSTTRKISRPRVSTKPFRNGPNFFDPEQQNNIVESFQENYHICSKTAKCLYYMRRLDINIQSALRNFPRYQRYLLALQIQDYQRDIYSKLFETALKKSKTTSLTNLNISHKMLMVCLSKAHSAGYFSKRRANMTAEEINKSKKKAFDLFVNIEQNWKNIGLIIGKWLREVE